MAEQYDASDTGAGISRPGALQLDPARYRAEVDLFDITEEQKRELLTTLWSIMCSFVELGFTVDLCAALAAGCAPASDDGDPVGVQHGRPLRGISMGGSERRQHEALISYETFQRIQDRLAGVNRLPKRQNLNADFPLRGFVICDDCETPLTSCWSTGNTARHPYYTPTTRRSEDPSGLGCESYR